jgi:hypothetical protein
MPETLVAPATHIEVRRLKPDQLARELKTMAGALWLAVDRTTRCHWVVEVATVSPTRGARYGTDHGVHSLVTFYSRGGEPVFLIESHDTIRWIVPGECIEVREGRYRGSVIVLQRLDDIDAPTFSRAALDRLGQLEPVHAIRLADDRYLEVASYLLSTGDVEIDAELALVEDALNTPHFPFESIDMRRTMLLSMTKRLEGIARYQELTSFVWLFCLREQISRIADDLVA